VKADWFLFVRRKIKAALIVTEFQCLVVNNEILKQLKQKYKSQHIKDKTYSSQPLITYMHHIEDKKILNGTYLQINAAVFAYSY
jgi:hypothetical protein